MNILAISYQNIGPFENKTITINFKKGKFLIKAPIGTGKSFLFFDGPLFGIYKYQNRIMLNRKSKEGFINTFFEAEGEYYFISRYITNTKTGGDSTKSRLFKINNVSIEKLNNFERLFENVVNESIDLSQKIKEIFDMEEITFKTDNELQNTLEDFLPPKEVFLSTNFLMQDSDNIFEMTPADRINVFKNIFGLLDIDHAKDIVAEEKKQVQLNLKIKKDTSSFDTKLKEIIRNILKNRDNLKDFYLRTQSQTSTNIEGISEIINLDFWQDIELVGDKVNILNFDISTINLNIFGKIQTSIENYKSKYQETKGKLDNQKSSFQQLNISKEELNRKKNGFENEKKDIENFLSNFQTYNIDELKKQKLDIQGKQKQILQNIQRDTVKKYSTNIENFWDVVNLINSLTEKGKTLKSQIANIDLQISTIREKKQNMENQLASVSAKIIDFQKDIDQQTQFFCEQIKGNCPYVGQIRGQAQQTLNRQLEILNNEKTNLEKQISGLDVEKQVVGLEAEKTEITKQVENTKQFFVDINWKFIKDNEIIYKNYETEIRQKDQKITEFEQQSQKIDEFKNSLISLQTKIEAADEQIKQKDIEIIQTQQEIRTYEDILKIYDMDLILNIQRTTDSIKNDIDKISGLIKDFKDIQFEIQKLQEEETVLNGLYQVLSKEFMLVVLQDFLPVLSDAINNYLAQIVDYELNFDLIKKSSDKLELDIIINDEKGQRQVKSLSGGQKTVLKLVWILAVSIVIKNDFLFLDETINNLDAESISKVADTLENFVKLKDMKFYVVTHSKTIQDMNIWDDIIELDKLNNTD